ncbi:MAG: hypothetical protein NWE95_07100 [Candidatus Bathyarchaeota archaeon]|nr:hypothetical protein [Candidatus Bathyarchaeota archaeon]
MATVSVNDLTISDKLGLLSVLPIQFTVAMIIAPILALIFIYTGRCRFSILLVAVFLMYVRLTPYMVEPLRGIDLFSHFSRVVVVNSLGNLPPTQRFYFDFPGSTILASSLLQITGLSDIFFLKYLFPVLAIFVQYFGILVLLRKTYKDSRYVGAAFLLSSFFPPTGQMDFSPAATALIYFSLMLYFFFYSNSRIQSLCFLILTFSITISNPTVALFSLLILVAFTLLIKGPFRFSLPKNNYGLKTVVFGVVFFLWVIFRSLDNVAFQIVVNIREFFTTIFSGTSEIPAKFSPPLAYLYEISLARRLYYGIGIFLSAIILLGTAIILFRNREKIRQNHRILFGSVIIFVCLTLGTALFVAMSGHPFGEVALRYAFFGIPLALGFLMIFNSKKRFLIFCLLVILLIVPTFLSFYGQEQYFLIRKTSYNGLRFAGGHINHAETGIVCDFGEQLFSFTNMALWDKIYFNYPTSSVSRQPPQNPNYYIFRIETYYYEEYSFGNSSYSENYNEFLNSNRYNNIYSSATFGICSLIA